MRHVYTFTFTFAALLSLLHAQDDPWQVVPADMTLRFEVRRPNDLLQALEGTTTWLVIARSPYAAAFSDNPDIARLARLRNALSPLLDQHWILALRRDAMGPRILLGARMPDDFAAEGLLREISAAIEKPIPFEKDGDDLRINGGSGGVVFRRNGFLWFASTASLATRAKTLGAEKSIASDESFAAARQRHSGAQIFAQGDIKSWVERLPDYGKPPENFLEVLLFSGLGADLLLSRRTEAAVTLGPNMRLEVAFERPAAEHPQWISTLRGRRFLHFDPDHSVADLRLGRDPKVFWARRFDDVHDSAQQSVAEFQQVLSTFFGGLEAEDILSRLEPGMQFSAIEVAPEVDADPDVRLPAFILAFETNFEQWMRERTIAAFQTAVGLANAGAGEERREPLLVEVRRVHDQEFHVARPLVRPGAQRHGTEMNFTPTLAFIGTRLVIASSFAAFSKPWTIGPQDAKAADDAVDRLVLSGRTLARVLDQNVEVLTDKRLLDGSKDRETAGREVAALIDAVSTIARLELSNLTTSTTSLWTLDLTLGSEGR